MKMNSKNSNSKSRLINLSALLLISAVNAGAQMPSVPVPSPSVQAAPVAGGEDFTWWYMLLGFLFLCLGAAVMWVVNSRKENKTAAVKTGKNIKNSPKKIQKDSFDINEELEWFRKNQNLVKSRNKSPLKAKAVAVEPKKPVADAEAEKPLPVFSIERLELARPFAPLPLSNDEALMSAIEQTYDEFEEDEEVREIALRILTAFKTRNSVEALAQMALYDLSSNLRSKAVSILSEFNHESVFESVLQATADPTREVRAAAARAMSKLTIDRADAWTRIFESEEPGRMIGAARAATESGFVQMSFDRLVHPDEKYSYEAVTLMALLIKAGETREIFDVLETHKNMNVRRAILHVIKVTKDQRALEQLTRMLDNKSLPLELQTEVDKTIEEIGFVTV
jgi:hypothetical protein